MSDAGGPQQTHRADFLKLDYLLLAALAVAALLSRFVEIGRKSIWIDEAVSWRFANVSLSSMFNLTAHDKHPPLYYGVLHYWVDLFGNSEAALRAPSAIAGAATIVLLGWAGWRAGGWLLGLSAGLLLLFNSAHLNASQEARMYALVGFLSLAASVALASYVSKPSIPRFLAYASLLTLAIYTHYSAMMVVGVHALLFAGYGVHELATTRRPWILLGGLATAASLGLAYIPWLSTFRQHLDQGVPSDIPEPTVAFVRAAGRSLVGLDDVRAFWLVLVLPLLGLGLIGVGKRLRDPRVVCVAAIALVPVMQILTSIWQTPVFNVRQAAPYTPGLAFVMALGVIEMLALARRWPRVTRPGYAVVAGFSLAVLIVMTMRFEWTYKAPSRQDWRSAVAALSFQEPIYVVPGYQWQPLAYYRHTAFGMTPLFSAELSRIAQGGDPVPLERRQNDIVLVVYGGFGKAIVPAFQRYFDVENTKSYTGGITVYAMRPIVRRPPT